MDLERMGWSRTVLLALGGAVGALVGVLVVAELIHVMRKGV